MGIEAKITSKGQATIPAEVREKLGLQAGGRIAFIETERGFLIVPRNKSIGTIFGSLAEYAIPDTSVDDYDQAIGEGISNHVEGSQDKRGSAT